MVRRSTLFSLPMPSARSFWNTQAIRFRGAGSLTPAASWPCSAQGDSKAARAPICCPSAEFRHLAIANPDLAPYGRAARETLESLGLLEQLRHRLVMGENIGQAFQYVFSGNAELGFVAWSQLKSGQQRWPGESWLVPAELHQPIDQQAVLLNDTPAARDFMLYMRSDMAIKVIREHGYLTP